ncbi:restriction endonuclease subunit S [Rhizobium ruizarguesonis]|uniref:restriction endonuclease subunit S n=1 Tax=Rhizobium ruizarguesonis TaxID=2081791 RepID=UPI0010327B42|nr:restriction endonuclease subunit S [Rhizobium ruizarguesonis]TBB88082.1 restriction endonuclease subunit S [Rhizobium ruizarguesonis]TBC45038.1 restriction endonuclease subunit S [Rhizobium ruizarguesonis]
MNTSIASLINNLNVWTSSVERKSSGGRGGSKRINLYGIECLRALIIDLAVRGKLVEQDPRDEPAAVTLARIARAKKQKIEAAAARKSKTLELLPTELPPLPNGWEWTQLRAICQINPSNSAEDLLRASFVPMALISNRVDGDHDTETVTWREIKKGFTHFAEGDVGIAKITPCFENGKAAIFQNLENGIGAGTTELHVARPWSDDVNRRYLLLTMKTASYLREGEARMTGTAGQKRVTRAYFEATPIPLPPLAEQQRIVIRVDELMALCDTLERDSAEAMSAHQTLVQALLATLIDSADATDLAANWSRMESHFDSLFTTEASVNALKQTVLELAVRGKLVPQDQNDKPASDLVRHTVQTKLSLIKNGQATRDSVLAEVDKNDIPFGVPESWAWARFPDLGILERGKSRHRPRNDPKLYQPGIYPLVQTGEVARANGIIDEFHSKYSELGLSQSKLWPKGTLCITIAANIADAAILGFDACFPDSVVGFIPAEPIASAEYFLHFMKTAKADLLKFAPSTAQKNINLATLETILIPIPPLNEMTRIIAKVDDLLTLCDSLKSRINEVAETQKCLADTIIERAVA